MPEEKSFIMKTVYITAFAAAAAVMLSVSCGNAGAQNKDKKEKAVKELTTDSFNQKVYDLTSEELTYLGDRPAIVDFTATWCGPCQKIAPILEELAVEYADRIVIYKVDVDKEKGLAQAFNVSSIPAILYIPANGQDPVMIVGARGKEKFKEEIKTLLF